MSHRLLCHFVDLAGRKSHSEQARSNGISAGKYASGQTGFEGPTTITRTQGELQMANREMRQQLRTLQKKQKQESKAAKLSSSLGAEAPAPSGCVRIPQIAKTGKRIHYLRRTIRIVSCAVVRTQYLSKITHELRQKASAAAEDKAERARRLEIKAGRILLSRKLPTRNPD